MNSSSVKNVVWEDSSQSVGKIVVNLSDGTASFLEGPPELEDAVKTTILNGVYKLTTERDGSHRATVSKRVYPADKDFEICLDNSLGLSGFALA